MTAAAQMGMNPFAALAAAGANPAAAAALGYNPYQNPFGGFNPAAAGGFGGMGGFAGAQNPMAGLGGAGLDPMGVGVGGLGFGMGPFMNPNTSAALLANTGKLFVSGLSLTQQCCVDCVPRQQYPASQRHITAAADGLSSRTLCACIAPFVCWRLLCNGTLE